MVRPQRKVSRRSYEESRRASQPPVSPTPTGDMYCPTNSLGLLMFSSPLADGQLILPPVRRRVGLTRQLVKYSHEISSCREFLIAQTSLFTQARETASLRERPAFRSDCQQDFKESGLSVGIVDMS